MCELFDKHLFKVFPKGVTHLYHNNVLYKFEMDIITKYAQFLLAL